MDIIRDKQKYASYIRECKGLPIFNEVFWLDAVCGKNNWHVVLVADNGDIVAAIPYYIKRKYLFNIVTVPKHTQRFSPCIRYPKKLKTYSHKIDFENKVIEVLLGALPNNIYTQTSIHFDYKNVLPLYWSGFRVSYMHTYVIRDISSPEKVFDDFSNNRKRGVKKASKSIVVKNNMEAGEFYVFHKESLHAKGDVISYSREHFIRLYNACKKNMCGEIFYALDDSMNIHAALFVVWDDYAGYHLVPVVNPKYYKSQAVSLIVYKVIEFLQGKTLSYDFEGSMLVNIEKAYREYGARPQAYFNIRKSNSKLVKHALRL
jgi:hypothetical protein